MIELADIHDADLVGIHVTNGDDSRRRCNLTFEREGRVFDVELVGVTHLRCQNFRQGNIAFHLVADPGVDESRIRTLLSHSDSDTMTDANNPGILSILDAIARREFAFVELQSSYGADVLCVCEEVRVDGHPVATH